MSGLGECSDKCTTLPICVRVADEHVALHVELLRPVAPWSSAAVGNERTGISRDPPSNFVLTHGNGTIEEGCNPLIVRDAVALPQLPHCCNTKLPPFHAILPALTALGSLGM